MNADDLDGLPVVFDFADIPPDGFHQDENGDWVDEEDGDADNSVLEDAPGYAITEPVGLLAATGNRKAQVKVVGPLRRELRPQGAKKPLVGKDIVAVKRALSRAKIIRWKPGGAFTPVAGPLFYTAVKRFQRRAGLYADGVYGNATHRALGKHYDAYAIKLYLEAKIGLTGAELKRQKLRAQCLYLYSVRHRVHYTMGGSRMSIVRRGLKIGDLFRDGDLYEDCSSSIRGLYKLAGHKDIMAFGYDKPWGFTGTMVNTGFQITPRLESLKIGDCFLTGYQPWTHTWMYIGSGLAFSHGKESDPRVVPWAYRPIDRCQRYIDPSEDV